MNIPLNQPELNREDSTQIGKVFIRKYHLPTTNITAILDAANTSREEKKALQKRTATLLQENEERLFKLMVSSKTKAFSFKYLEQFILLLNETHEKLSDIGIIFIDVNNLKTINDTQGHAEGDRLLLRTSALLQTMTSVTPQTYLESNFRIMRGDFVVHRSGDEFIVVCLNTTNDQNFLQHLEMKTALLQKTAQEQGVSFSFGVDVCPKDQLKDHLSDTIITAERKMQTQKDQSKPLAYKLLKKALRAITGLTR